MTTLAPRKPYALAAGQVLPWLLFGLLAPAWPARSVRADEPPALNPFAPIQQARDDAVPGYVEMSNGKTYAGRIYLTRDKRLKLHDQEMEREREIPLRAVKQINCKVAREWMEKEWRFKETTSNEKYYTGREYPVREYVHTVTLRDGRTLSGPLAEVIYIETDTPSSSDAPRYDSSGKAERVLLHKRDNGDGGTSLNSLIYVRLIKLGETALEEGRKKAEVRGEKEGGRSDGSSSPPAAAGGTAS